MTILWKIAATIVSVAVILAVIAAWTHSGPLAFGVVGVTVMGVCVYLDDKWKREEEE